MLIKFPIHIFRGGDTLHPFKYLAEIEGTLEAQSLCGLVDLHIFFFQQPFGFRDLADVDIFTEAGIVVFAEQLGLSNSG